MSSSRQLKSSMMFNMSGPGLLGVAESGATPRTPEILNSLMSMTNPFDRLRTAAVSPHSDVSSSPPSVQTTCSQLIKEGLKLTIQTKRKANGGGSSCGSSPLLGRDTSGSPDSQHCDTSNEGLTPEDEERRRRRRERNKIAATKCRQKKRERTNNLVYESEALETQNLDLKSKIQELEKERRKLVDVLSIHKPNCNKHPFPSTSSSSSSSSSSVYQDFTSRSDYSSSHYPSNYEIICTSESSSISYHRNSTVIEDIGYQNPYLYKERNLRDPIMPYTCSEIRTDDISRADRSYGNIDGGRPYPLRLVASASSSDYESNTELLDSPSGGYQFPDDPSSSNFSSSSIFPTSSCMT